MSILGIPYPHPQSHFHIFHFIYSSGCVLVSHCGFICVFLMTNDVKHLSYIGHIYIFFCKALCNFFAHILMGLFVFSFLNCKNCISYMCFLAISLLCNFLDGSSMANNTHSSIINTVSVPTLYFTSGLIHLPFHFTNTITLQQSNPFNTLLCHLCHYCNSSAYIVNFTYIFLC